MRPAHAILAAVAAIGIAAAAPVPASAASSFKIHLQSIDDDIALSDAMVREGERRAGERINEIRQWIGWWTSVKALAEAKQTDLKKNIDQRQKNAALLLQTLQSITTSPKQSLHVPNYGWYSVESATALAGSLAQEARKLAQAIKDGKDSWHIITAGWVTGGQIQGRIDGLTAEIASIDKAVGDGKFSYHGPSGWATIGHWRDRAAAARKRMAEVKETIAKGAYALEIPGIGRVTRTQLEKRLAGVEARIAKVKATGTAGNLSIHRPSVGWVTARKLQKQIDDGERSFQAMKKTVADGLLKVHFAGAGGGWWSRETLEKRIASTDETISDTTAAIRAGDYKANVLGGWTSLNGLKTYIKAREKRLADPNLTAVQRNQIAELIEKAHKAIKELAELSALDLALKGLERTKFTAWAATVLTLAKPDFEHRKLKREEMVRHMGSFDGELKLKLQPLEAERDRYLEGMKWFASD